MESMTLQEIKTRIVESPYEVGSMSIWLLIAILEELQRLHEQAESHMAEVRERDRNNARDSNIRHQEMLAAYRDVEERKMDMQRAYLDVEQRLIEEQGTMLQVILERLVRERVDALFAASPHATQALPEQEKVTP